MTDLIDANGQGDDLILSTSNALDVLSAKDTRWRYTITIESYYVSNSGQFIAFGSTSNGVADGKPVDNSGHVYVFDGDNHDLTRVTTLHMAFHSLPIPIWPESVVTAIAF